MRLQYQWVLPNVLLLTVVLTGCSTPKQDSSDRPKQFVDQLYEIYTKHELLFSPNAVGDILDLKLSETRCISTYPKKEYCGYSYQIDATGRPILKNNFRYRINEGKTFARIYFNVNENSECLKKPLLEEKFGFKLIPTVPVPSSAHEDVRAGATSRPFKFTRFFLEKEKSKISFQFNESSDCIEAISVNSEKR